MRFVLKFEIRQDGADARSVVTGDQHIRIGRSIDASLQADDSQLDDLHSIVEQREDGMIVVQNHSQTGGTLLNGEPIASAVVREGDVIQCGATRFRFLERSVAADHRRHRIGLKRAFHSRIVESLRSRMDVGFPAKDTRGAPGRRRLKRD